MVDTAMGVAVKSVTAGEQSCATVEIHVRFFRPVREGRVTADTRVVHAGADVVQVESVVEDERGRRIASGSGTFAVLDARETAASRRNEGR